MPSRLREHGSPMLPRRRVAILSKRAEVDPQKFDSVLEL